MLAGETFKDQRRQEVKSNFTVMLFVYDVMHSRLSVVGTVTQANCTEDVIAPWYCFLEHKVRTTIFKAWIWLRVIGPHNHALWDGEFSISHVFRTIFFKLGSAGNEHNTTTD